MKVIDKKLYQDALKVLEQLGDHPVRGALLDVLNDYEDLAQDLANPPTRNSNAKTYTDAEVAKMLEERED